MCKKKVMRALSLCTVPLQVVGSTVFIILSYLLMLPMLAKTLNKMQRGTQHASFSLHQPLVQKLLFFIFGPIGPMAHLFCSLSFHLLLHYSTGPSFNTALSYYTILTVNIFLSSSPCNVLKHKTHKTLHQLLRCPVSLSPSIPVHLVFLLFL